MILELHFLATPNETVLVNVAQVKLFKNYQDTGTMVQFFDNREYIVVTETRDQILTMIRSYE